MGEILLQEISQTNGPSLTDMIELRLAGMVHSIHPIFSHFSARECLPLYQSPFQVPRISQALYSIRFPTLRSGSSVLELGAGGRRQAKPGGES
jgi:hypothetical protein